MDNTTSPSGEMRAAGSSPCNHVWKTTSRAAASGEMRATSPPDLLSATPSTTWLPKLGPVAICSRLPGSVHLNAKSGGIEMTATGGQSGGVSSRPSRPQTSSVVRILSGPHGRSFRARISCGLFCPLTTYQFPSLARSVHGSVRPPLDVPASSAVAVSGAVVRVSSSRCAAILATSMVYLPLIL